MSRTKLIFGSLAVLSLIGMVSTSTAYLSATDSGYDTSNYITITEPINKTTVFYGDLEQGESDTISFEATVDLQAIANDKGYNSPSDLHVGAVVANGFGDNQTTASLDSYGTINRNLTNGTMTVTGQMPLYNLKDQLGDALWSEGYGFTISAFNATDGFTEADLTKLEARHSHAFKLERAQDTLLQANTTESWNSAVETTTDFKFENDSAKATSKNASLQFNEVPAQIYESLEIEVSKQDANSNVDAQIEYLNTGNSRTEALSDGLNTIDPNVPDNTEEVRISIETDSENVSIDSVNLYGRFDNLQLTPIGAIGGSEIPIISDLLNGLENLFNAVLEWIPFV
ncbi:MAG: hypothetical protein H8Z69_03885 [Nanohaloarchaea archaeon]|nr:hypothetical protein [Candidatus Nanohaloarchaea archaeon]